MVSSSWSLSSLCGVVVVVVVVGGVVVVVGGAVVVVVVVGGVVVVVGGAGGRRGGRVVVGGGAVVGGGVVVGGVGVHSSSDTCTDVDPSVTVAWQLLDWKLVASTRKRPSSSAGLLADDSAEVTHTRAWGTASSPSTLRPSSGSSSARSTNIAASAFGGRASTDVDTLANATPTVIRRARLATGLLIAPPPTTPRGSPPHWERASPSPVIPLRTIGWNGSRRECRRNRGGPSPTIPATDCTRAPSGGRSRTPSRRKPAGTRSDESTEQSDLVQSRPRRCRMPRLPGAPSTSSTAKG